MKHTTPMPPTFSAEVDAEEIVKTLIYRKTHPRKRRVVRRKKGNT